MHRAKIIAVTQPVEGSAEELIAYCARVSNPKNQGNHDTAPKLLAYLRDHGHWSPFEMVHVVMEILTTRDIARQILRHRSFSFQEFSQRYADPTQVLGFVHREARLQGSTNRQSSIPTDVDSIVTTWHVLQSRAIEHAELAYEQALALGIAKEQARALLPEGLTVSRLYMAGSLRSWIHYCEIRCQDDTQAEHRRVATSAQEALTENFPMIWR